MSGILLSVLGLPLLLGLTGFWALAWSLPDHKARRWALRMAGDGCGALLGLLGVLSGTDMAWSTFNLTGGLLMLWWDYREWRKHRDDDDDWGKRLKAWGKSHLPKPVVLQLRPGVGAAMAAGGSLR